VAEFYNGDATRSILYINGVQQSLSQRIGTQNAANAYATSNARVSGLAYGSGYNFMGTIDEVQIFNGALGTSTVGSIYSGTQSGRYLKTYYDGLGRKIRSVQRSFFSGPSTSGYRQETYTNNWQDRVVTSVNANGSVYRTAFDSLGRATSITNPDSSIRTTSYDDVNRLVTMTDEVGRVSLNVYDVVGRLTSVRQYYSSTGYNATAYSYDLAGELLSVADPLGQTTRHAYDDAGRLIQTTYPDGTSEGYVYDNLGNLIAKTDRSGRTVRYAYDALNRRVSGAYPGGSQVTYSYDNDGNLRSVLNGTATVYFGYDNLNRMTSRSLVVSGDSTNYTASYAYDAAGNLLNLTYPDGQGTLAYAYDPFYRVTSMTFGGSAIGSFTYRKDDLLSTISYGDNTLGTYVFNDRGFPLQDKVASGSSALIDLRYTENSAGDITGITDKAAASDIETYGYDKQDRLTSAIGPWGSIAYLYDAAGNRLREDRSAPPPATLRPNANGATLQWSPNGCTANWACVAEVASDGDTTYVSTTAIGATDLYRLPTLPFGSKGIEYVDVTAVARNTYTPPPPPPPPCPPTCPIGPGLAAANRTGVGIMSGTDDAIYLRVNGSRGSYRSLGNTYATYTQRWTTDPATGQPWTTAAVNALQAGVEAGDVYTSLRVTQLYVTVKLIDGAIYTYSTGPTGTNQLASVNRNGVLTSFRYDANGNVVNRGTSSSNAPSVFDLESRLVKACTASPCTTGNMYTFAYDGLGDRVQETGPSGSQTYTNTFVASGDAMLYLKNVVGSTMTKTVYLYAGSLLVATVSGSTRSYFHEDHLGNTRLVTQSGSVVFSTNYEPFGVPYGASGSDPSVKYTGQWSEALGLYWNHARFYDPTLGRFVSADPVLGHMSSPQTLDRYAYAVNNPMRFADPSGMDCSWNPLSWGDCVAAAGNVVYENTVGAAVNSYNWYIHASASDQRAFWAGVLTAVAVGALVGASCVFAGCAGLVLLAVGIGTSVAGSFLAGGVYLAAGGQSAGGLQATMFWGGIGAGVGFAVGGAVASSAASFGEDFLETQSRLGNLLNEVSEDVRASPEEYLSPKAMADEARFNAHLGTAIHEELAQRVADDPFLSTRLAYNRVGPDFTYVSSDHIYLEVTTPGQVTAHSTRFLQQGITGMFWYLTY
jgi:RHS repeat-associated protein